MVTYSEVSAASPMSVHQAQREAVAAYSEVSAASPNLVHQAQRETVAAYWEAPLAEEAESEAFSRLTAHWEAASVETSCSEAFSTLTVSWEVAPTSAQPELFRTWSQPSLAWVPLETPAPWSALSLASSKTLEATAAAAATLACLGESSTKQTKHIPTDALSPTTGGVHSPSLTTVLLKLFSACI